MKAGHVNRGGKPPNLKNKVRGMLKRREILTLISQGMPVAEIVKRVGLTQQTVRKHLHRALETESFPSNLTPESVAELRTVEAEGLARVKQKLHATLNATEVSDAMAIARLGEAYAKISERLCRLLGLDAPVRILEQQLRLELKQGEDNVVRFDWNQEALECDYRSVPGLTVNGAPAVALPAEAESNNDESELPPAAA
jgi:predicted transcriptional regulator